MIRAVVAMLLLSAVTAWADAIPGTVISSKVTTGNTVNTFPVLDVTEALGGHREVADVAALDAIPAERRREGMTVWVIAEQKGYRLIGGTANANWFEESFEPKNANIQAHIGNTNNPHLTTAGQIGAEPALGNPTENGMCSKSYTSGGRYWEACGGSSSSETRTSIVQKVAETPADDTLPLIYKNSLGADVFRVDTDTGTVTITGVLVIK